MARLGLKPNRPAISRKSERNKQMVEMYLKDGGSYRQIAAVFKITPQAVGHVLRRCGVEIRSRPRRLLQRDTEIARLNDQGGDVKEIAARFGLRPQAVYNIWRGLGYKGYGKSSRDDV
jgi:DNA invertase Pin-like site-specific DNA recombinase